MEYTAANTLVIPEVLSNKNSESILWWLETIYKKQIEPGEIVMTTHTWISFEAMTISTPIFRIILFNHWNILYNVKIQ